MSRRAVCSTFELAETLKSWGGYTTRERALGGLLGGLDHLLDGGLLQGAVREQRVAVRVGQGREARTVILCVRAVHIRTQGLADPADLVKGQLEIAIGAQPLSRGLVWTHGHVAVDGLAHQDELLLAFEAQVGAVDGGGRHVVVQLGRWSAGGARERTQQLAGIRRRLAPATDLDRALELGLGRLLLLGAVGRAKLESLAGVAGAVVVAGGLGRLLGLAVGGAVCLGLAGVAGAVVVADGRGVLVGRAVGIAPHIDIDLGAPLIVIATTHGQDHHGTNRHDSVLHSEVALQHVSPPVEISKPTQGVILLHPAWGYFGFLRGIKKLLYISS